MQLAKEHRAVSSVDREMAFTEAYRRHENEHPFTRELECLRVQTSLMFQPIEAGDWFAGRIDRPLAGLDPERGDLVECAYYCRFGELETHLENPRTAPQLRQDMEFLMSFWKGKTTYDRCRAAFPERLRNGLPKDNYYSGTEISYPMFGLGGPCLDYEKLVRLGVGGLRNEVAERRRRAERGGEDTIFFNCLLGVLDIFGRAIHSYAAQAAEKAGQAGSAESAARFGLIAGSLEHITEKAPETYHQAVQIVWLYSLAALAKNYGRMDLYLGDFLARDLDEGRLSSDEARRMTAGLWELISARGNNFNNRMIIGGRGRRNEANADRFALLALEVQGMTGGPIPQIALRWHEGMNPRIWDTALEVIGNGSTQPMLYNDDVNIPAAAKAFGVTAEEAEQCVMYGCGEYVIDHRSIGSPDAALNLVKALNVTLHNGRDPFFKEPKGLAPGPLREFGTFEAFKDALARQMEHEIGLLAEAQAAIYKTTGEQACYPFLSLLYDDCVERGKPLLAGGVRYLGGTLEAFGSSTVSDSLVAIKKAVYEDKTLTPDELLAALDANFEGHERVRGLLRRYPKFGNDDAEADGMSVWLNGFLCRASRKQAGRFGLDTFMIVLINNGDSILFGKTTAASPDGRKAGQPVSNGNQPGAGYDQSGLTALLNSMAKLDPSIHAGAAHNAKISRKLFKNHKREISSLVKGFFQEGGTQLMVTVTDREELERAMEKPEQYANLIIRVGGYSERFIDLPRDIQKEVIKRTLY